MSPNSVMLTAPLIKFIKGLNLREFLAVCFYLFLFSPIYGQEILSEKPNYLVEKGRYFSSLNFSLDQHEAENEDQLLRYVRDQDPLKYP